MTGDFGGAGFLVGGTETATAAEADGVAECVGEGAPESAGVRVGLALGDGVAGVGVPVDLPD
ncbi:hypothetical protein ABZV67_10870 [Streptomyces sp. NPDC005065]|uniref:hypothetical protein n=1 Tax=unclassified Streptomyces TaxID=2593676 RepID=UPI0033B89B2D